MKNIISTLIFFIFFIHPASAAITSKTTVYQHEDTELTGVLYWDDAIKTKRPGILLVHEWWGLNDYANKRAKMLAEFGYVVFAADMYGTGKVTTKPTQAKEWMQEITTDVEFWQERAAIALNMLKKNPLVDANKTAAVGYCFGGGTVLQMAYSGQDVKAVIGFHSSLPAAPTESKDKIKSMVMIFHGAGDTFVSDAVIENFRKKLQVANANWRMIIYGGDVKHGFTNPDAGNFGIKGLQYNKTADQHSWSETKKLLEDLFK